MNDDVQKYYQYNVLLAAPNGTKVCTQGMGWQNNRDQYWRGFGCGSSGNGAVNWGNVAAYPALKATSTTIFGVSFVWI